MGMTEEEKKAKKAEANKKYREELKKKLEDAQKLSLKQEKPNIRDQNLQIEKKYETTVTKSEESLSSESEDDAQELTEEQLNALIESRAEKLAEQKIFFLKKNEKPEKKKVRIRTPSQESSLMSDIMKSMIVMGVPILGKLAMSQVGRLFLQPTVRQSSQVNSMPMPVVSSQPSGQSGLF